MIWVSKGWSLLLLILSLCDVTVDDDSCALGEGVGMEECMLMGPGVSSGEGAWNGGMGRRSVRGLFC